MQQRIDTTAVNPAAYKAMAALQTYVDQSGLDAKLRELIKIRASQINGCAFCLIMHTRDARKLGESDDRMHLLDAWREAPVFTARTRGLGLDRSGHIGIQKPCARRCLCRSAAALFRERNCRPHCRGRCHQQLEPDCGGLPHAAAGRKRKSGGLVHDLENREPASEKIMHKMVYPIRFRPLAYCCERRT